MNKCETCAHWETIERDRYSSVYRLVGQCQKMKMRDDSTHWTETKWIDGKANQNATEVLNDGVMAFVNDGSDYFAALYTTPEFGCVQWESQ